MPVFPLGSQLVPGLVLPLHLFEQRYRALAADLAAAPAGRAHFGVVGIRTGLEVGDGAATSLFEVGTLAEVTSMATNPDGTVDLQTVGSRRFTILELDDSLAYLRARVRFLGEPDGPAPAEAAAQVRPAFARYGDAVGLNLEPAAMKPRLLSYLVTAALVLPGEQKQELLAAPDTTGRLLLARRRLAGELAMMRAVPSLPALDLVRSAVSAN